MTWESVWESRIRKGLPADLQAIHEDVVVACKQAGLDTFPVVFEMVTPEEMSSLAAYGGFPTRYPHWRFGMEFEQLHKSYTHGVSKIYEMVINTDPCYAYLMNVNHPTDQKLVMAHVYGHCDFCKNNMWFGHTDRKMVDTMANHAARVRRHMDRLGQPRVEEFLDLCLTLDNLIDVHGAAIRRQPERVDPIAATIRAAAADGAQADLPDSQFKSAVDRSYLDPYINPPEEVLARRERLVEESLRPVRVPERPERDVLGFLLQNAPLRPWEADLLGIVRAEALYFAPQGQTKIMNEGWATFWHTRLMTGQLADAAEIVHYADATSGTTAMGRSRLNPYKLGLELFRDIEARWDTGRHGPEWEQCDDLEERRRWFVDERGGLEKIFEVRRIYNDVQFVDAFLTEEFCRQHGFFAYGWDRRTRQYVIESREFAEVKRRLLEQLTNFGQPIIEVVDANFENRGELLLEHRHGGYDLDLRWAESALGALQRLWRRPAALRTRVEGKEVLLRHDGQKAARRAAGDKA